MGSRTERQLLEDVEEMGYVGLRAPASGARPGSEVGDLWVGREWTYGDDFGETYTDLYIIEEKYKSNNKNKYIQHDGNRLDLMIEFAERLGATPVLAIRWSTRTDWSPGATHFCIDAREVERTPAHNISIKPETAERDFVPTDKFFR